MSYIKINRKIFNHWVFDDAWAFKAWIDLIGMANYEESHCVINNRKFTIKRGEILRSYQTLSRRWDCSFTKTRNFLNMLQSDGMVTLTNEKIATRIKIANYEDYQGIEPNVKSPKNREKIAEKSQKNSSKEYKERKNIFREQLATFVTDGNREMCNDFYRYWTETSMKSDKMRFEMEKVFDIGRRLSTWARNQKKFHTTGDDTSNDLYNNVMKQINGTNNR
jgi:hypothetical protein